MTVRKTLMQAHWVVIDVRCSTLEPRYEAPRYDTDLV